MRTLLAPSLLSLASLFAFGCHALPPAAPPAPTILPLRTLHLYETGVGYFERSGEVGSASATSLPVPAGHLDDALKTLVILSPGGGVTVRGLEFGSSLSKGMARMQAGLPLDADTPVTYRDLLDALKGAAIEVTLASGKVSGRLIEVVEEKEQKSESAGKEPDKDEKAKPPGLTLLLLTDGGEIRKISCATVTAVRAIDPAFAARLGSSLDALSTRNASTPRLLELLGTSKGPVTFGYIAETPVWRASYRLVLAPDQKSAVLQGWALLHNDTDESWRGVKVSLVNGQPDSFLFPLAAPRYVRRTLVHPDDELSTVPQLAQKTPDAIWGDHLDDTGSGVSLGTLGSMGYGSGSGYGSGHGSIAPKMMMGQATVTSSSLLSVGDLASVATGGGTESGALFTYALGQPLDLSAHKSALVPFLGDKIDAEAITWIDGAPRAAVRFVNSTAQTLPAGTIAFFANAKDGAFIGESALDRLKPGERRFIDFGADLDVELTRKNVSVKEETKRVRFFNGMLEEHFLRTTEQQWEIENHGGRPRDVYVVLHLDRNATLKGADKQDFDGATSRPVAMFHVAQKSNLSRPVTAVEGLSRRTALVNFDSERFTAMATQSTLPPNERAALSELAGRQKELEATRADVVGNDHEIDTVEKDLVRLREHLKALGDKGPATNPFVQRILAAEDKLASLRKRRDALAKESEQRTAAVKAAAEKLK